MTKDDLLKTHKLYDKYSERWKKYHGAYEGYEALRELGYFRKHERESDDNYISRLVHGYGINYSQTIVDILDFYISREVAYRNLNELGKDTLWSLFMDDCDFYGTDFDIWLNRARKQASIYGHSGIIIDMPRISINNREENVLYKVYPYLALYTPLNILDWVYERDIYGKPELVYLKLLEEDGTFKIWNKSTWTNYTVTDKGAVVLLEQGENRLQEIPFVWLYNDPVTIGLGKSDLHTIASLDISLYVNLMSIEEIVDLAAFPMMRKPMARINENVDDRTGVSAVLEFDPEQGEAGKPDWLPAEVGEPIQTILEFIQFKIDEIYRSATLDEAKAQRSHAESGFALKLRKELLESALGSRNKHLTEAELGIIYFWCLWVGKKEWYDNISVERAVKFSMDDLQVDLENALVAKGLVLSATFGRSLQKRVSKQILEDTITENDYKKIEQEIDAQSDETIINSVTPAIIKVKEAASKSKNPLSLQ